MKILGKYLINQLTCSISPMYGEYGNEGSIVIERNQTLLVNMSPIKIIDHSLLTYGFNYEGARAGSKHLLDNKNMNPIVISEKLGIYLIPTMSHTRKECVWFTLSQYQNRKEISKKLVEIIFKNGETLSILSSLRSLNNKLDKARELKYIIEEGPSHNYKEAGTTNDDLNHLLGAVILDPNTNVYSVAGMEQS